jgi:hypothetical protein
LTAKAAKDPAQNAEMFAVRKLGHGALQIPHAHATKPGKERIGNPDEQCGHLPRYTSG